MIKCWTRGTWLRCVCISEPVFRMYSALTGDIANPPHRTITESSNTFDNFDRTVIPPVLIDVPALVRRIIRLRK